MATLAVSAVGGLHLVFHALPPAETHLVPTGRIWSLVVHALTVCRERQRPVGPDLVPR